MSGQFRRYEMLLPLRFNDGEPVPDEVIGETLLVLRRRFGAVTCETQTLRGVWEHEAEVFRDELMRIFVDVPDTDENRRFFATFKETSKRTFKQIDIWMTTYPVEVI